MPSLFLSHSGVDKPFVEKLATGLERVGVDVWYDKWAINVGDSLTERINEGVEENEYLGFVLSPDRSIVPNSITGPVGQAGRKTRFLSRLVPLLPRISTSAFLFV